MSDISEILEQYFSGPNMDFLEAEKQIQQFYLGLLPEKKISIVGEAMEQGNMVIPDILEETDYMNGWNEAIDQMAKNIREKS